MFDELTLNRFWSKVDKSTGPDGCWIWTARKDTKGYGVLKILRKWKFAHRISLCIASNRNLDFKFHALHSCDNPPCVNPAHLRWGTQADNIEDMFARGRQFQKTSGSRRGELNPGAKITSEQARAIRHDTRAPIDIATSHGISRGSVRAIKRRITWSHVEG